MHANAIATAKLPMIDRVEIEGSIVPILGDVGREGNLSSRGASPRRERGWNLVQSRPAGKAIPNPRFTAFHSP